MSQPLHYISRWAERTGEERSLVSLGVWRFSPKLWCQSFSFKLATFTLSSISTLTFIPSVPSLLSTDSWDCVELKNTQSLNGKNEKKFFPLMPATCFKKLRLWDFFLLKRAGEQRCLHGVHCWLVRWTQNRPCWICVQNRADDLNPSSQELKSEWSHFKGYCCSGKSAFWNIFQTVNKYLSWKTLWGIHSWMMLNDAECCLSCCLMVPVQVVCFTLGTWHVLWGSCCSICVSVVICLGVFDPQELMHMEAPNRIFLSLCDGHTHTCGWNLIYTFPYTLHHIIA